ncbi:hypothetical protein U14_00428 [Candidatus Moduliflexus flocculans]|uniref:Uncharacterized protein n=1 Tax=Candidatus Moduliflexus flocculans TaxID=1499966 RepID=A0A0S6VQ22_9BACT|nr:hypothetical protein U14_00428 [Candidatus Moduliflexus flocculans]
MNAVMTMNAETLSIIRDGWRILVEQLGIRKATEFVVLLERGQGDSVVDIANYWGDAAIDEIYQQVTIWKTAQSAAV